MKSSIIAALFIASGFTYAQTSDRNLQERTMPETQVNRAPTESNPAQIRDEDDRAAPRSDARLTEEIRDVLREDPNIRGQLAQVRVQAQNGEVTLRGNVDSEYTKQQIEDRIENIDGIRNVDNQIRVNQSR